MKRNTIYNGMKYTGWVKVLLILIACHLSFITSRAQDVTVQVTPVQQVLPPQAGLYLDDPGSLFIIRLINNTDQVQQVHFGLQLEQRFPEQVLWVSTNMENNHIPRQPITLQPNQHKTLNKVETRHLFDHFASSDFYIREGDHFNTTDGDYGLMPEGEYELFLTAYKWDPELTSPVVLSDPKGGNAIFNICYAALPPSFQQPLQMPVADGLNDLKIYSVNKNIPIFQWTAPTLNCNVASVSFNYDVRIVELGDKTADEAMERNTISEYEANQSHTTFTIPTAYVNKMIGYGDSIGKVYAMQVTAKHSYQSQNVLHFSLLENDGKSPIILFRLFDPNYKRPAEANDSTGTGGTGGTATESADSTSAKKSKFLYEFEQPMLTRPSFAGMTGRKAYVGDNIYAEWRKAWYVGGIGDRPDTVRFEYSMALYKGNSADKEETIFKSKPVFEHKDTLQLQDTIKWEKVKDQLQGGDYLILRVKAKCLNVADSLVKMYGDSLNYKDFVLTTRFNENYQCGNDNRDIANKNPLTEKPGTNRDIKIGEFYLTFNEDVKQDDGGFTGTGWIRWNPKSDNFLNMNARVAVKFEKLKVNTEYEVYEGKCKTYPWSARTNTPFTDAEAVDSLFSLTGLDNVFGNLSIPEDVQQKVNNLYDAEGKPLIDNVAKSYGLGQFYSKMRAGMNRWDDLKKGDILDLYFPLELPDALKQYLPKDFSLQIGSMQFSPQSAQMNLIGEVALPNSDIFDGQDMLVFGAPRLCISPDKFWPDEGVLALLSNLPLKDPSSDFRLVFKAPSDPLDPEPDDGCFLRWADGEFGGLGLEIAANIPNTNRIINGKPDKKTPALIDLKTVIRANQSAGDFIATGTLTPFEVKDLPGWTFTVTDLIVFDHNMSDNDNMMPSLDEIQKAFSANIYVEKSGSEKGGSEKSGSEKDGADKGKSKTTESLFDPQLCGTGVQSDWNAWQGVYIKQVSVGFPKFSVLGGNEKGVEIGAKNMIIDGSGVTCQVFADNLLTAETASVGGWRFSIDHAAVDIVQNNFDNCVIQGGIGVPLFHAKSKKDNKKGGDGKSGATSGSNAASGGGTAASGDGKSGAASDGKSGAPAQSGDDKDKDKKNEHQETDLRYTCEIRHLTDPSKDEKYYTYHEKRNADGSPVKDAKGVIQYDKIEHTRRSYDAESRFAYLFTVEEVGDLDFSCFVADAKLVKDQTYLVVEAEDNLSTGEPDTRVELCVGGDISIGGTDSINERLKELSKTLKLDLKIPGIHFTKFRISNKKRNDWHSTYASVRRLQDARDAYDKKWAKEHHVLANLLESEEMEITQDCYLDLGEWSLASARKKLGPFSFNLEKFKPSYTGDKVFLDIKGDIGLVEDKICVGGEVIISSTVDISNGFKDISLSNGEVDFKGIKSEVDFTDYLHFKLDLQCIGVNDKDSQGNTGNKGYKGDLTVDIKGLLKVECKGGFFQHEATDADMKEKEAEAKAQAASEGRTYNAAADLDTDRNYSWGYFWAEVQSEMMRVDPVVINRINGGFYFNCRPTKGSGEDKKFNGDPIGQYGMIGIALGVGMNTTAGKETLNADVDLLVVYDRQNSCLSTFMFNGKMAALSNMFHADVSLIYENAKDKAGQPIERYLCLNVTSEFGVDGKELSDRISDINGKLNEIKGKLDEFQKEVNDVVAKMPAGAPMSGLGNLAGQDENGNSNDRGDQAPTAETTSDSNEFKAGQTKVNIEFKITWKKKDEPAYAKPKWHLYIGEPAVDRRCTFTYLKFKSKVCTVDIGANGYVCIGNELPDNGKLPPIPNEILEFLGGHKVNGIDMGADAQKAESSRAQAVRHMLETADTRGGVMVGASCWGNIDVDLGLIYGGIHSLAGFDASLINYGPGAICVNTGSGMGWDGWYAMGQLYAMLDAELGIRIKIGKLINEDLPLLYAGIGGLLEMGLPSPTWMEGKLRVKMKFLGGLFKVDKKFSFSAGDHCVPFVGNALDGFEMFQNVSLGSDSIYEALYKPEFAIRKTDASRMTFTTNTSLGSHYRLVDPSYSANTGSDSLLNIHNSRTYVFDMNKDRDATTGMKMGVRLFDLGTLPTTLATDGEFYDENQFKKKLKNEEISSASGGLKELSGYDLTNLWDKHIAKEQMVNLHNNYATMNAFLADYFYQRETTTAQTSTVMTGKDITSGEKRIMEDTGVASYIDYILDNNVNGDGLVMNDAKEVNVSFREDKGTQFHLTGMNLQPGHSYMLVLFGDAYEIQNGRKQWVDYYYDEDGNGKPEYVPIKWKQSKLWFFRVKSEAEDKIEANSLLDLTPYVALAYPSVDGTNVKSVKGITTTAYMDDILHPTIALNRDLRTELPYNTLKWRLNYYKADNLEKPVQSVEKDALYKPTEEGKCINLEPESAFEKATTFVNSHTAAGREYDFNDEVYNLQLTHTFKCNGKDSTVAIVDLWLTPAPYDVTINGNTYTDNWMQTTDRSVTGKLLPYVEPFVGARPWQEPTINYEQTYRQLKNNGKENDDWGFIFNTNKYDNKPIRLLDPYLYLAYLSKWTFVGDRIINKYAFDDVQTPFGSESLIFQKGSTVMNAEMLKNDGEESLYHLRNDFYGTWNDWYYNNANLPKYSLPMTLGTVSGMTANNQDERTSTITPVNLNHNSDQTYNLTNLVKDFTAPYDVASQMSRKLYHEGRNLFFMFSSFITTDEDGKKSFRDDSFNQLMKQMNDLNRGRYIECKSKDVTAKVPYYQLPLIFGDCFKQYDYQGDAFTGDEHVKYKNLELNEGKRSFRTSIGKSDITSKWRYWTQLSNLFFFRLIGNEKDLYGEPEAFCRISNNNLISGWNSSYVSGNKVAWDEFDMNEGLKSVSTFKARIYRVDAYNISTGLYTLSTSNEDTDGMGAGPWFQEVAVDANNGLAKNLAEMNNRITKNESYEATHFDQPVPQAIYTSSNKTLSLILSDKIYQVGTKFEGADITDVWSADNFYVMMTADQEVKPQVKTVKINSSFAKAKMRTTANWFEHCENLETIEGLNYLNMSRLTDMTSMFRGCRSLKSIDLSVINMSKVEKVSLLLAECTSLTSVKMNFDLPKATDLDYMFWKCQSLTKLDISNLVAAGAKNMSYMFYQCTGMKELHIENLAPKNCMETECMFNEVGNCEQGITVYYSYYLDKSIKAKLPSCATRIMSHHPAKALVVQDSKGEQTLLLLNSMTDYAKNYQGTIKSDEGKTYTGMTVKNVWNADQIRNAGNNPVWNSYKNSIKKIIIDNSFENPANSRKNWFNNCANLKAVEYQEGYLGGKEEFKSCPSLTTVTARGIYTIDASSMFSGCTSLTKVPYISFPSSSDPKTASRMFENCGKLKSVEMSELPNDASYMFLNCEKLEKVKVDQAQYSNIKNMNSMFENCKVLKEIDFSDLETNNLTTATSAFKNCLALTSLKLHRFTTKKCAQQCGQMFSQVPYSCHIYMLKSTYDGTQNIKTQLPRTSYVNLHLIDDNVMALMVQKSLNNYKLVFTKPEDSKYNSSSEKYDNKVIKGYWSKNRGGDVLEFMNNELDYSPWSGYVNKVTEVEFTSYFAEAMPISTKNWFKNFGKLTTVNGLENLKTGSLETMEGMFSGCSAITTVSNLSISEKTTSLANLFTDCSKLSDIRFSNVNTSNVTDMSEMFKNCMALTTLQLENWSSASLTKMDDAFHGCTNLRTLKLANGFTASNVGGDAERNAFYGVVNMLVDLPANNVAAVRSAFVDKLGFVEGKNGWIGRASMEEAMKTPQVIWTADNNTLTFYYGSSYEKGEFFGKNKITSVWKGDDVVNNTANGKALWTATLENVAADVKVVIDESFAAVKPKVTKFWFAGGKTASIEGLQYLNTSEVTDMNAMFKDCKVTSLDLSTFSTGSVIRAWELFSGCSNLKNMTVSGAFNLPGMTGNMTNAFTQVSDLDVMVNPATSTTTVNNAWVNKLAFTGHGRFVTGGKVKQAIWTSSNKTLTFVYKCAYSVGQTFKGKTITNVWANDDFDALDYGDSRRLSLPLEIVSQSFASRIKNWTNTVKETMTKVVIDPSFADAKPESLTAWFSDCTKLTTIEGLENLNTENVTSLSYLFYNCQALASIDLSHFNTSKVTHLDHLFHSCSNLKTIDISSFDTENVTNMSYLFSDATSLTSIVVGNGFNTWKVTDMAYMFNTCSKLTDFSILSRMNTENVKYMQFMFAQNNSEAINAYRLNTKNVTNMKGMFYKCENLTKHGIQAYSYTPTGSTRATWGATFVTNNVTDMSYMFANCKKLNNNSAGDWAYFNTEKVTNMEGMFMNCMRMTSMNIASWNTSKVKNMNKMFHGCAFLQHLTVGENFSVASLTNKASNWFGGNSYKLTIKMPSTLWSSRKSIFYTKLGFSATLGWLYNTYTKTYDPSKNK